MSTVPFNANDYLNPDIKLLKPRSQLQKAATQRNWDLARLKQAEMTLIHLIPSHMRRHHSEDVSSIHLIADRIRMQIKIGYDNAKIAIKRAEKNAAKNNPA